MSEVRCTVAFTGVIGVGKSTISHSASNIFEKKFGYKCSWVKEPIEHWKRLKILERFYEDQKGRSLEFQVCAWASRLTEFANIPKNTQINFCDSHMIFDRAFLGSLYEQGKFTDEERDIYMYLWKGALGLVEGRNPIIDKIEPDIVIYLGDPSEFDDTKDQSPCVDMCLNRIKARGRPEEIKNVDRSYLYHLKKHYHKILFDEEDELASRWEVKFVNANRPKQEIVEEVLEIVHNKVEELKQKQLKLNEEMVKQATAKFMKIRNGSKQQTETESVITEMMEIMRSVVMERA